MTDFIKRVDALKAATLAELDVDFVIEAIRNIPASDVVEVVRCKDCKHRLKRHGKFDCIYDTGDPFALGREAQNDEWFCADGERRNGND